MKHTILLILALLPLATRAQMLHTYTASVEQSTWQSIATTGTQLTSVVGDYGNQTVTLPFDFPYGLSDYPAGSIITVRADGFVKLRNGNNNTHNALSFWDDASASIICPFLLFDGQMPSGTSGCWWQVMTDDNGEQMLVIEYRQVQHYPAYPISSAEASQDDFNYQLRLHENGDISCLYGHMHNGVSTDTLFNFFLTDGANTWQHEIFSGYTMAEIDHVALLGTWGSLEAHYNTPGSRSGNSWQVYPNYNLAGCPDSGTLVTWHRPEPPCPHPTQISVSEITHNSALLSWTPNEVIGSLVRIQYDTINFTPGSTGHNSMLYGGDTCHLSLLPNHNYWVSIRSDCGADSSAWHTLTFPTPCTPLTHDELPLTEDFEGRPENDPTLWDGCWKAYNGPAVKDVSSWDGRPNMALKIINIAWMHLPPVDSVRTTLLRFRARGPFSGTGSKILYVGVMADPFDIGTFDTLQSFTIGQSGWQEYMVPFATYNGTGNTVAFRWGGAGHAFIDDIELSVFDGCLQVDAVTVDSVGQHSAIVNWNVYMPASHYNVVWYPSGYESLANSVTVSNTHVTLNGLDANTSYTVQVYSLCGDTLLSEPASALFHTRCAIPLPMDEDFDIISQLPDCWNATSDKNYSTSGSYTPPVPLANGQEVTFSSKYTISSGGSAYYERGILLLPFVDTVVNRLRLTFDYRVARFPYQMSLIVGVIPGDDDLENFIPVTTFYPHDTLWHNYTVETGALSLSEGRLVMIQHSIGEHEYVQGYNKDLGYVDNIHIEVLPQCDRPAAVWVTDITSTSALIHWQENDTPGTYLVECDGTSYTVVGDTVLPISGLMPSSGYVVGVRHLCVDGYTNSRTASFLTACEPITTLPWTEDFEMWSNGDVDPCWLSYQTGGIWESVVEGYTFNGSLSGTKTLRLSASNHSFDPHSYDALVVLPEMGMPLSNLCIGLNTLNYYSSPANMVLELGVMADAGDSTTFRHLDTIAVSDNWSYYQYGFGVTDSGRVALRLTSNSGSQRLLIDELSLFPATDCHRPDALTVDTVTQHSATITITDSASIGSYRLYWHQSYSTAVDSMDVSSTSTTISGLASGTDYTIRAAALCYGGSHVSNTIVAECFTDCDTIFHSEFPYTEAFNGSTLNRCWSVMPAGSVDVRVQDQHLTLYGTTYNPTAYAVMPAIDTLAGTDLTFRARKMPYSSGTLTIGVFDNSLDSNAFTPVQAITLDTVWTDYQVSFVGNTTTVGHHIAFRANTTESFPYSAHIDDITLSPSLPCARPDSVSVDSIGATSATLTIADPGNVRHYRVLLTSAAGTVSQYVTFDSSATEYHVSLTGLTPATEYSVTAASVCYDGSITFQVGASFTTLCAPMALPYRMNFDSEPTHSMPRCWLSEGGTVRVIATNANSGTHALYASIATDSMHLDFSTAELACGDDSLQIIFFAMAQQGYSDSNWQYHQVNSRLQVFSSLDDSLTLLFDDTLNYSENWQFVNIATAPLPYGTRLLFRLWRTAGCTGSARLYLDDFKVTTLHPAPQPRCDQVAYLNASDVDYTSATVSWIPQGDEQRWEIHLRGDGTNITAVVDSTTVTFNDLSHSTAYAFLVRPLCNDTLTGPWSDTLSFSTPGCPPVSTITIGDITATSATVNWLVPEGQNRWIVNYGRHGFTQGDGATIPVEADDTATSASLTLTGLEPETTYDVYLRTLCGEELQSVWSPRVYFTTSSLGIADSPFPTLTVSPNPTTGTLTLEGLTTKVDVELLNMTGRRCGRWTGVSGSLTVDLSGHASGGYFLRVGDDRHLWVGKVVKR